MKIDEHEKISIWLAGNTGLRNPMRIQDGYIAFSQSPYVGNLHGRENEVGFMELLNEKGVIRNEAGKDVSGSHARKWRLMFERYGFIYGQAKSNAGYNQNDLGGVDEITPFGKVFLNADTVPAIQECFLRSLGVEQYSLPNSEGFFSPFRWILAIMLELEKRTGTSEISRIEFALWGHTTNPSYELNEVVDHILDLRERRNKAPAKRTFDRKEVEKRGKYYDKKKENFLDYCDMNMRYLRISGVLQRKGRGLIISQSKHAIAEAMSSSTYSTGNLLERLRELTSGASLPTDSLEVANKVLKSLEKQMKECNIFYDISDLPLNTPAEVNIARRRLEEIISQTEEIQYAAEQKEKWKEISDYMSLLINGGGRKEYSEDYVIEVPKDETPAYLEWVLWRAALAINHMKNKPYEVRGFKLDSDFMPVTAAGGGKGDLYCEFDDFTILTEVTMSTSSRQEAMEGEPVRRHVSDAVFKYDKPVYGMFIAVKVDTNTAETFRHGVWYAGGDQYQRLNIVPLSLEQFQKYFEFMFKTNQARPEKLVELIDRCSRKRDRMEAPAWKTYIDNTIRAEQSSDGIQMDAVQRVAEESELDEYGSSRSTDFPFGIYFGTRIKDMNNNRVGCVVGIGEEHILVAFEDAEEPTVLYAYEDNFEDGQFVVA